MKHNNRRIKLPKVRLLPYTLILVITLATVLFQAMLNYSDNRPERDAINRMYALVAQDASITRGDMSVLDTVSKLQDNYAYRDSDKPKGIITGKNTIYWDKVISDKWDRGGINMTHGRVFTCYRLSADTDKKAATVEPKPCSDLKVKTNEFDSSEKQVVLDKNKIEKIRESRHDDYRCYAVVKGSPKNLCSYK